MKSPNRSLHIFFALCILCIAGTAVYFRQIVQRFPPPAQNPPSIAHVSAAQPSVELIKDGSLSRADVPLTPPPVPILPAKSPLTKQSLPQFVSTHVMFRYTGVDNNYGKLALVDYKDRTNPKFIDNLSCEVVYYAAGRGICLTADRGVLTTYGAQIFDDHFKTLFTFPIDGVPSRCRISPDGKMAAVTYFLNGGGHSYTSLDFSTQTLLIDTHTGRTIAELEQFAIEKDGHGFKEKDFNFWGVTFTPDSKGFFCTLSSNRKHYLVKGDTRGRSGVVIHENVECPSLSPDGMRVAFKKRVTNNGAWQWRLTVLDLKTRQETSLADERSVDDQLEWLDNAHVLYSVSDNPNGASAVTNVWRTGIENSGPEMVLAKAYSPAVIRTNTETAITISELKNPK